jgi:hypothetical protein
VIIIFCEGVGYAIVYTILKSIFDNMNISLKYEDLYDAKTRLKELCDMYKTQLTNLNYKYEKDIQTNILDTLDCVYHPEGKKIKIPALDHHDNQ